MNGTRLSRRRMLRTLLALGVGAGAVSACAATPTIETMEDLLSAYSGVRDDLPDPREIERVEQQFKTVIIYDRTGEHLLYQVVHPQGDRVYVPLARIPLYLQQGVIAIEDKDFYTNPGVDPAGVGRAFVANSRGDVVQGGSTITMQLVKNVLIPPEERYQQTYDRKVKEALLAIEISRLYPGREGKDRILEWYLNTNYLGNFAYGVGAAARAYFGKDVWDLSLAECAMLAHLQQSPALNPVDNPDAARKRQGLVLDAMVRDGYITPEQADAARREELVLRGYEDRYQMRVPHFSLYVRQQLERLFGEDMYRRGLRVISTIDLGLQEMVQEVTARKIAEYGVGNNAGNAAAVIIRPETGEVLAMVGSVDYNNQQIQGQVNMAVAPRQPGSSFKPYTYLTAFEMGYTAASMVLDTPVTFRLPPAPPYSPRNIDQQYHGVMTLRRALACSYNVPAVKLLHQVGITPVVEMARRLGITTLTGDNYGLALTLGANEVRLVDQVFAYSIFANGGLMRGQPVPERERRSGFAELMPAFALRIEDAWGRTVMQFDRPEERRVADERHTYVLTSVLSDAEARRPAFGASAANLVLPDRTVATKTGSTDGRTDGWTVGYTPQYAVGVWIGNANRRRMSTLLGSTGAGPIYREIMGKLHEGLPALEFARPEGLIDVEVCSVTGFLPGSHCKHLISEVFVEGTEPTEPCVTHYVTDEPEREAPPAEGSPERGSARIDSPGNGESLSGTAYVSGSATSDSLWYHKVEYSSDGNNWTTCEADYMKTTNVSQGVLATWNTHNVANGSYWLRVVVVDVTGNYVSSQAVAVTVAN